MTVHAPTIARQKRAINDLEEKISRFEAEGKNPAYLCDALRHVQRSLASALSQQSEEQAARTAQKEAARAAKRAGRSECFLMSEPQGDTLAARVGRTKVQALREALEKAGGRLMIAARLLGITERQARYIAKEFAAGAELDELLS